MAFWIRGRSSPPFRNSRYVFFLFFLTGAGLSFGSLFAGGTAAVIEQSVYFGMSPLAPLDIRRR